MSRVRADWIASPATKAVHRVLDLPIRLPVKVTSALGLRAFRPLNETVHVQALFWKVRYLPQSSVWKVRHRVDDIRMTAWRIKNVEVLYWKKTHGR